ncbi:MAG: hypothetical protein ACKOC8_05585 [Pirellulales bacterium]
MLSIVSRSIRRTCVVAVAVAGVWLTLPPRPARCEPAATSSPAAPPAKTDNDDDGDLARKAEIMNSPRWRRAIFELGEWLSTQQIYSPQEVHSIKVDFNRRVAAMSSYELDYLLDDLDAKFKIIDTPEARDAKQWLGQYLSVMSDSKRAEVLKDVPNVVEMSSAQLQQEIMRIEQKKSGLQQRQAAFDQGRQQLVDRAQAARQATAAASNAAARSGGVSYSPYRSQGGGKPPFSDVKGSGMSVGVGPWGAYVGFSLGNF